MFMNPPTSYSLHMQTHSNSWRQFLAWQRRHPICESVTVFSWQESTCKYIPVTWWLPDAASDEKKGRSLSYASSISVCEMSVQGLRSQGVSFNMYGLWSSEFIVDFPATAIRIIQCMPFTCVLYSCNGLTTTSAELYVPEQWRKIDQ
jgi:hypothetical protein